MSLYPFKFHPRFVEKMWGGRKLQTVLGKAIPPGKMIGESWELYDFPPGVVEKTDRWVSSTIANGVHAGRSLHWAVDEYKNDLYGDVPLAGVGQFPILIKFLDAREDLSVQVHPDANYAAAHSEAHLKSEAWYVMENDPGARLFKGLAPGTTAEAFTDAIAKGDVEKHLTAIATRPGQCFYLQSGTVHALGAGMLVAEVQTPSDTTFRVYDFNRVDPTTGKLRTLHVEQAMQCIDFSGTPEAPQIRNHVAGFHTTVTRLATSPYFTIEKVRFSEGVEEPVPYDEPVVWIMLEGSAQIKVDGVKDPTAFGKGETLLLPAAMKKPMIKTLSDCVWLEVTFPTKQAMTP